MEYEDIIIAIHNNHAETKVLEYLLKWLIGKHELICDTNAHNSATISLIGKLVKSSQTDKIVRQAIKDICEE